MSNEVIGSLCYRHSLHVSIFSGSGDRVKTYHFRRERDIGLNRAWDTTRLVLWIKFDEDARYLAIRKDDIVASGSPEVRMRSRPVRQLDKYISQRQDPTNTYLNLIFPLVSLLPCMSSNRSMENIFPSCLNACQMVNVLASRGTFIRLTATDSQCLHQGIG